MTSMELGPLRVIRRLHVVPEEGGEIGMVIGYSTAFDVGLVRPYTPDIPDVSSGGTSSYETSGDETSESEGRPSDWDGITLSDDSSNEEAQSQSNGGSQQ